ncbi:response regulator transcription factor [Sphingobacterium hungaricum]|uniref:Two component transcriptional regulator, LuxR family n=1 Tax=Sphingobacterium hungaricum TaxID=2082723 RepID=A0A928UT06_9SPHI|nr:response regulator transcription factor [Sphingobacterium hungaricum]MBE8712660.1 hypothetical protein [Sphingobacterium hungaricum]
MHTIRQAVILDDHKLFADSFSLLLEKYDIFDLIHVFYSKEEFSRFLLAFGTDEIYVFLDYYLEKENGLSLLSDIKRISKTAKTIFVTSAVSPLVIKTLEQARPNGIISKSCGLDIVVSCISSIRKNQFYVDPKLEDILSILNQAVVFSPREVELLAYFSKGMNISKVAEKTYLSPHTIISHRRNMMSKVNCNSITQLLNYAKENQII